MHLPRPLARVLLACLCFASGVGVTVAVGQSAYPPLEVLVSASQTVLGQDIEYPAGKPVITAAIVTLEPGASTGSHRHEAPLFAMVMEGELTVDYGTAGSKTYVQGDAFLEAFRTDHNGTNTGQTPVRILAVYAGSESVKNTIMAE